MANYSDVLLALVLLPTHSLPYRPRIYLTAKYSLKRSFPGHSGINNNFYDVTIILVKLFTWGTLTEFSKDQVTLGIRSQTQTSWRGDVIYDKWTRRRSRRQKFEPVLPPCDGESTTLEDQRVWGMLGQQCLIPHVVTGIYSVLQHVSLYRSEKVKRQFLLWPFLSGGT